MQIQQNRVFANEIQKQGFVNLCEFEFSRKMDALTDVIISNPDKRMITLSGPTCSGKTVTARNITHVVTRAGRKMFQLSIDDFYRDREELNREAEREGRQPDYDSIDSIDLPRLAEVITGIYHGEKVVCPLFDFKTGKTHEYYTFDASMVDVVLIEGIQAIYPEVTALFSGFPYVSVSINVRSALNANGSEFSPRDLRLMRRIVRDVRTRGTSPERTLHLWEVTVIPNEEKSIIPYENNAMVKIDSLLAYEPYVIRDALLESLATVPASSPYCARADELAAKVEPLQQIDPEYVPYQSLYSEFLGRQ
ncbi:MAG: hypothetical protein IJR90_05845 [Clostridia bacterium]|nr:hypothetical protein [Clostridia bacterium]